MNFGDTDANFIFESDLDLVSSDSSSTSPLVVLRAPLPPPDQLPSFPRAVLSNASSRTFTRSVSGRMSAGLDMNSPTLEDPAAPDRGEEDGPDLESGMDSNAAAQSLDEEVERARRARTIRQSRARHLRANSSSPATSRSQSPFQTPNEPLKPSSISHPSSSSSPANAADYSSDSKTTSERRDFASARDNILSLASAGRSTNRAGTSSSSSSSLASFMGGGAKPPPLSRVGTGPTEDEKEVTERLEREMAASRARWSKVPETQTTAQGPQGLSLASLLKDRARESSSPAVVFTGQGSDLKPNPNASSFPSHSVSKHQRSESTPYKPPLSTNTRPAGSGHARLQSFAIPRYGISVPTSSETFDYSPKPKVDSGTQNQADRVQSPELARITSPVSSSAGSTSTPRVLSPQLSRAKSPDAVRSSSPSIKDLKSTPRVQVGSNVANTAGSRFPEKAATPDVSNTVESPVPRTTFSPVSGPRINTPPASSFARSSMPPVSNVQVASPPKLSSPIGARVVRTVPISDSGHFDYSPTAQVTSIDASVARTMSPPVEIKRISSASKPAANYTAPSPPINRNEAPQSLAALFGSTATGPRLNKPAPQAPVEEGPMHARGRGAGAVAMPGMVASDLATRERASKSLISHFEHQLPPQVAADAKPSVTTTSPTVDARVVNRSPPESVSSPTSTSWSPNLVKGRSIGRPSENGNESASSPPSLHAASQPLHKHVRTQSTAFKTDTLGRLVSTSSDRPSTPPYVNPNRAKVLDRWGRDLQDESSTHPVANPSVPSPAAKLVSNGLYSAAPSQPSSNQAASTKAPIAGSENVNGGRANARKLPPSSLPGKVPPYQARPPQSPIDTGSPGRDMPSPRFDSPPMEESGWLSAAMSRESSGNGLPSVNLPRQSGGLVNPGQDKDVAVPLTQLDSKIVHPPTIQAESNFPKVSLAEKSPEPDLHLANRRLEASPMPLIDRSLPPAASHPEPTLLKSSYVDTYEPDRYATGKSASSPRYNEMARPQPIAKRSFREEYNPRNYPKSGESSPWRVESVPAVNRTQSPASPAASDTSAPQRPTPSRPQSFSGLPPSSSPAPSSTIAVAKRLSRVDLDEQPQSPSGTVRDAIAAWGIGLRSKPTSTPPPAASLAVKESYGVKPTHGHSRTMSRNLAPEIAKSIANNHLPDIKYQPPIGLKSEKHAQPAEKQAQPAPQPPKNRLPAGHVTRLINNPPVQSRNEEPLSTVVYNVTTRSATPFDYDNCFYDKELLLIVHRCRLGNGSQMIKIWTWIGRDTVFENKARYNITQVAKQLRVNDVIDVPQGRETREFVEVLGGQITICRGWREQFDPHDNRLFSVRSQDEMVYVEEVDSSCDSICSAYCVVLSTVGEVYAWFGHGSLPIEQQSAADFANALADGRQVTTLTEGAETAYFWHGIDGMEYAAAHFWRFRPKCLPQLSIFRIDSSSNPPLTRWQSFVLSETNISLIDSGFEIWVIIPPNAKDTAGDLPIALEAAAEVADLWKNRQLPYQPSCHTLVFPTALPKDLPHLARGLDFSKLNEASSPTKLNVYTVQEAKQQLL